MRFPSSKVLAFYKERNTEDNPAKQLRLGQHFFAFMKLEKCQQEKEFCDKLYYADDTTARALINDRIDWRS